jgi:two-component system sensor histidine kinase/response regulator
MAKKRSEVVSAIALARADLDRALASLELLADDDQRRVSYSAHALNNYLMSVATTLQLLRTKLAITGDRDVKRWLDSLKHATNLMMSTARGIVTATPDIAPLLLVELSNLSEIADKASQAYRDIARQKRIRLVCTPRSADDRVLTDGVAAGAVLDNLLSNALKYSPPGTVVSVSTTVSLTEALCSVTDHGPGLSEADQAKLFQRGVPLIPRPTGGESSTGYGLAIASDLAKALGGRLSCTSVVGEGSCFTFALPLAKTDA